MKKLIYILSISSLLISTDCLLGAEEEGASKEAAAPAKCAVRPGNDADPKIRTEYEGKPYLFCSEGCQTKFAKAREESLYHKIGGKAAVGAAVDLFYKKVLADDKVNHFFDDVEMKRQIAKQKDFVSAALGGPEPWTGKSMRKAHKHLKLTGEDFGVIAVHLQTSLEELKVDKEHIAAIMKVVGSTKDDVLNRSSAAPKPTKGG